MIKAIATDLDGTLFYPKEKKKMICEANLFLLQQFADKGGKICLVSGRSIEYGKKVINKINRDCTVIGFNGSVIYSGGKIVFEEKIKNEEAKEIINNCYETFKNIGVMIMTDKGIFVHVNGFKHIGKFIFKIYKNHQKIYAEDMHYGEDAYKEEIDSGHIYKIMLAFGFSNKAKKKACAVNKILRSAYENLESSWSEQVVEVTPKGCNKASGVVDYIKYAGLKEDEIAVVGDSGNDISMFKKFYSNSFCMARAAKVVKKYAKYEIDTFKDLGRYIFK
jgi:Cof subfamily protein (haloacid dehalogenase superfamily)